MTDDELIARLRAIVPTVYDAHDAADRIEALTAEVAGYCDICEQREEIIQARTVRIKTAEAERDEALNQLDSARHSVDALEKRVAAIKKDCIAVTNDLIEVRADLDAAVGALGRIKGKDSYIDATPRGDRQVVMGDFALIANATLARMKGDKL